MRTITDPTAHERPALLHQLGARGAGAGVMPVGDGSNAGTAGTALRSHPRRRSTPPSSSAGRPAAIRRSASCRGNIKNYFATLSQGGTGNPIVAQNIVQASPTGEMTIQGAVDVYRTNFGTLQLAPDRFCPAHQILLVSHRLCRDGTVARTRHDPAGLRPDWGQLARAA